MRIRRRFPPACTVVLALAHAAHAFQGPETVNAGAAGSASPLTGCSLASNTNGTCANYRWYDVCSGYLWSYAFSTNEAIGVQFGGPEQPCVAPGNVIQRVIAYYNVVPSGYPSVTVAIDRDDDADGCPEARLRTRAFVEPAQGWNCFEFDLTIPGGVSHLLVREVQKADPFHVRFVTASGHGACAAPTRSFYYGPDGTSCEPWTGPGGRPEEFLTWLVIDSGTPTGIAAPGDPVEAATTWGHIKGLFR